MFKRSAPRYSLAAVGLAMALALAVQAAPGKAPDAPAGWLATGGKDAGWTKATAKCRELLGQLKVDDPLVKRHLPKVKRGAELVGRIDKFDWKRRTALDYLENMLADLIAGKVPSKRYAGKGLGLPYWSDAMARAEAIWIHVPPSYDPAKSYQIFMYYKCGGGIHYKNGKAHGGYRPTVEVANQTDTFHAWSSLSTQVKGRLGANHELAEAMAAVCREFSVDRERVFLTGWSDGGFTTLWLASRHPHLVAGIVPYCANWQYMNIGDVGLYNVPTLAADGWSDGDFNRKQFVRWHILRTMGYPTSALWSHHGHSYQGYEDVEEFKMYLAWAKTKRRNLWPKRVRYATWGMSWHRAYWVSIERMANPIHPAQIDVQVKESNRIEVKTWHVGAYKLTLSDKLVDPAKAVTVVTDGKESYAGPFKAEILVDVTPPPTGKFVKGAAMPGDITTQIERSTYGSKGFLQIADRRWVFVKGTGGDEGTRKLLAKWFNRYCKDDTKVTEKDIAKANLFVYGGPGINKFAARIAADLPVKFGKGKFTIGSKVYDKPTHCVAFIHPNPLNPSKYVIVYAFNDAAAFAKNRFFDMGKESAWRFRSGDCVVKGVPTARRKWGVTTRESKFRTDVYVFGPDWRPADETPVGELAGTFDETQMMRLRADAMREATGADAGVIWGYTARYQRWRPSLPAGPVTADDIATFDRLPQYVVTGEVTGAQLKDIAAKVSASTVLASGPAKIDPKKTYRLAMGYSGLPSYGVDYKKMPKHFVFKTPEEFLASKLTRLSVRNMKMLPMTMSEAVIRYVAKRKTIAPRPTDGDLTQYIMNPKANRFGAFDWLHLGADVAWERASGQKVADRHVLSFGLTEAGGPKLAPPRKNSRHFLDADLTAADKLMSFGFAGLDKKLPVAVTVGVRRFAVTAGAEGKAFALATDPSAAGVVGRGVLLDVRLANKGKKDVTGLVVLSPQTMRRIHGSIWPVGARGVAKTWYCGFRQTIGKYRKPPVHQNAVLLLSRGPAPQLGRLSVKGGGYNFGLVAAHRPVSIKAGETVSLPVLFVFVNKPAQVEAIDLAAVLEAIKDKVMPAGG